MLQLDSRSITGATLLHFFLVAFDFLHLALPGLGRSGADQSANRQQLTNAVCLAVRLGNAHMANQTYFPHQVMPQQKTLLPSGRAFAFVGPLRAPLLLVWQQQQQQQELTFNLFG